jgi:multiple sugar transport system substrate-binding protein
LYETGLLDGVLAIPPEQVRMLIDGAVPRPVTPVYTELSHLLQIHLHRTLSGQETAAEGLRRAGDEMRDLLRRVGLAPDSA